MKYKTRKAWRHFKYGLLKLFFGKPELKRLIDLDELDFADAVNLKEIKANKHLTELQYEYFSLGEDVKYGLKYELARMMADTLAEHMDMEIVYDDNNKYYKCTGTITLCERKKTK